MTKAKDTNISVVISTFNLLKEKTSAFGEIGSGVGRTPIKQGKNLKAVVGQLTMVRPEKREGGAKRTLREKEMQQEGTVKFRAERTGLVA